MKSTQAASEIKPTLLQVHINKFNRKLKAMRKDTVNSPKKKPSKPWWIYSAGWKKFTQRLKMPQKILQQQEKFLHKQNMLPTFSFINNQNKNEDLSPDMEIIKITTVVEAIRQKRQKNAQVLEAAKNIQKIIGKKRSKRSSYKLGNNLNVNKDLLRARQGKTIVSRKKSSYPKSDYRKQQTRSVPTRKQLRNENTTDLKTASNEGIPSTEFYKRIWEYINGTRPHSEIISNYNPLENNSEKDNSTCTEKERIIASQEDKLQMTSPNTKLEQDFYKRIWDIISTIQLNGNAKARSKRNASIPKSKAISNPLCVKERTVNYEGDKQVQATNEETSPGITDTTNSPETSNSGPYISGFWTVANKTQWQPKTIPVVNIAQLNNDLVLFKSSLVNSASEVDDLNKLPDKVENVDYSSSNNSTTGYTNEARNSSEEIITEPGPPYSSEESFDILSFSSTEGTVGKALQDKDQAKREENNLTTTTPGYNPLNIPYVDVPDYSDQQEDSLDKSNRSATAARHEEYDDSDYDYGPKPLYDVEDFSSKSPRLAEIKVVQTKSDEPDISLNANNSRSSCTESKDSAECIDKYDVEDTKLRNNTEDVTDDDEVQRSVNSTESEENENTDFVDFDINEYKKPLNLDEFFKNDPILKSIRANNYGKYGEYSKESEEAETYATGPKTHWHDYFAKNEDSHDDQRTDDRDETNERKEETDSYAKKETKDSETIDESHYDKDFFKHIFGKGNDKESEYQKENPDRTEKSEEDETPVTDSKDHKENPDPTKELEKVDTYATDPKEQSQDYFAKDEDYHNNHRIASNEGDKTNDREEIDSHAKQKVKESEAIDEDSYPYNDRDEASDREEETDSESYAKQEAKESEVNDEHPSPYYNKNFFKDIFGNDDDKESFETAAGRENEFLSRYFSKDVLHKLKDNSTTEEDKQREESRNKEDIRKTLSKILDKKDQFSRLDDNLNKMIEKGEAVPIKYNNFWSLEYESPRKRHEDNEEETEDSKEA